MFISSLKASSLIEGTWKNIYNNGGIQIFTITKDGLVKKDGRGVGEIKPVGNQVDFPTSQGWVWIPNLFDATVHDYARLISDGTLQVKHGKGGIGFTAIGVRQTHCKEPSPNYRLL